LPWPDSRRLRGCFRNRAISSHAAGRQVQPVGTAERVAPAHDVRASRDPGAWRDRGVQGGRSEVCVGEESRSKSREGRG
jgi:hypothetical protein